MNPRIAAIKLRIAALEAELLTCETAAQDASVRATLDDAWRALQDAEDDQMCEESERQLISWSES